MFDSTEPSSESWVTRSRPACMAHRLTMTSVALPNVALSRPPTVSDVYSASCSVMKPRRSASGHMPSRDSMKVHPSPHAELEKKESVVCRAQACEGTALWCMGQEVVS